MNSFLQPLVDELKVFWEGVGMHTSNKVPVMVRAALLCVGYDIPAACKVCGFLWHRALMGCLKCLLPFPTKQFGEYQITQTSTEVSGNLAQMSSIIGMLRGGVDVILKVTDLLLK